MPDTSHCSDRLNESSASAIPADAEPGSSYAPRGEADLAHPRAARFEGQTATSMVFRAWRADGPPPVWGKVPPRNPNFTDREEFLDRLGKHFTAGGGTMAVFPLRCTAWAASANRRSPLNTSTATRTTTTRFGGSRLPSDPYRVNPFIEFRGLFVDSELDTALGDQAGLRYAILACDSYGLALFDHGKRHLLRAASDELLHSSV